MCMLQRLVVRQTADCRLEVVCLRWCSVPVAQRCTCSLWKNNIIGGQVFECGSLRWVGEGRGRGSDSCNADSNFISPVFC